MIEIQNLSKTFPNGTNSEFVALRNISLVIQEGECVVFRGVSGSGKSTLLSILGAMAKPSSGGIMMMGENIAKLSDDKVSRFRLQSIGFIFQSFHLLEDLSIDENIWLPLVLSPFGDQEKTTQIENGKKLANVLNDGTKKVRDLSGGEKQRVAIARALVNDPMILLADEPTANLDRGNCAYFLETIEKLKKMGKTIILASHDDQVLTSPLIDKIFHIAYGELIDG